MDKPQNITWYEDNMDRFYDIRGRYHCLFKQRFGPPHKVMKYEDCLKLFLLELQRYRETLLKKNSAATQANQ